jgi:hypothetical protein
MRCARLRSYTLCAQLSLVFTQVAIFTTMITTMIGQALFTLPNMMRTRNNKTDDITKPLKVDSWPVPGRKLGSGAFGVVLEGTMADGSKVCTTWLMAACILSVDTQTHAYRSHKDMFSQASAYPGIPDVKCAPGKGSCVWCRQGGQEYNITKNTKYI